ncbi:MAG: ABC transporter ATP-binding protein [Proteobacteria bacterium]|nr:ABC transporter ATP-binding protein [Pseudomonadota bacterium]MBS0494393.1 ABC transporter ATP-binding protein [Pseudomonadota bacterium]
MSAVLQAQALSIGHGRRCVAQGLDFALAPGEVLCLLGANGSGKTTLLRTLLGLLAPLAGEVRCSGQNVAAWPRAAFARHVGYVPQAHAGLFPFSVEDVVLMGRAARVGRFAAPGAQDRQVARQCLELLGIAHLRASSYTAISGGERQLALIARALAQQPALLVMDEPTASLDFGNQIRVLEHIERLRAGGMAVLMSTHQPEHALRIADRIALLGDGRLMALGAPHATATPAALAALYGVSESAVAASLSPFLDRMTA